MNSTVGPIFNEKIDEKWSLSVLWTVNETPNMAKNELKKSNTCFAKPNACKKKKKTGGE